jgi:hypothetical protein
MPFGASVTRLLIQLKLVANGAKKLDSSGMKLMADAKRRVVLPPPIKKGDVLLLQQRRENQWLLTRVERPNAARIRKLKGKSVADALAGSTGTNINIMEMKREKVEKVQSI